MSQKYSAVTTFNQSGYDTYGHKMIQSFIKNWPVEVQLHVYTEDCVVKESAPNIIVKDLHQSSPALVKFKHTWKDVPKANGDVTKDPIRSRRKDAGKGFKWHAVKFAHKVYAIFACAEHCATDTMIWMDADTICHSTITMQNLHSLIPADMDLCYLGRKGKYSECGLYAMNLKSSRTKDFLKEFQRVYDQAESGIFLMEEWHDSFVFDRVRERFPQLKQLDWAAHLNDIRPNPKNSKGEGHPLINSDWGAYLDHLKGSRKKLGRSNQEDLKVARTESYWQK
jgi:hypothetical protein